MYVEHYNDKTIVKIQVYIYHLILSEHDRFFLLQMCWNLDEKCIYISKIHLAIFYVIVDSCRSKNSLKCKTYKYKKAKKYIVYMVSRMKSVKYITVLKYD